MGDYTTTGVKLETCGRAYYATKSMIEALPTDTETSVYLNPKNKCMFAFPYPEFDNKKAGEISIFHKEQKAFLAEKNQSRKNAYRIRIKQARQLNKKYLTILN